MKYFFFLLSVLCFIACGGSGKLSMPDDGTMEKLRETHTDSLATVLENIDITRFSKDEKMNYAWWLSRLHFMQGRNLVNDTLIHEALAYYKEQKSPRVVYSYIIAAEQINALGNKPNEGKELYEKALEASDYYNDTYHNDYIIRHLISIYDSPKEEKRLKELLELLKESKQPSAITYYTLISTYSIILNEPDSLSKYANEGIEFARKEDSYWEYEFTRMYVEGLNKAGRHSQALRLIKDLEKRLKTNETLKLNYISTFIGLNELDSARYYIEQLEPFVREIQGRTEGDVIDLVLSSYKIIIDSKEGKPISLGTIGYPGDKIMQKNSKRIRADRERQFVQNKLLKQNLTLDIERGKMKQRFLWAGIVALIIVTVVVFAYQRKLLQKERSIRQAKEQLRLRSLQLSENELVIHRNKEYIRSLSLQLDENGELKQEIDRLTENNRAIQEENDTLQKDINNYLTVIDKKDREVVAYDKLAEENERLSDRENLLVSQLVNYTKPLATIINKPHYIDITQWPEVMHAINQLFDGFTYRLHADFPGLTEEDIRYCGLIKLRLSNSVIAILTGVSPSSVTKRKQRIKEKMSQQRPLSDVKKEQSLEIYLWNYR